MLFDAFENKLSVALDIITNFYSEIDKKLDETWNTDDESKNTGEQFNFFYFLKDLDKLLVNLDYYAKRFDKMKKAYSSKKKSPVP